MSALRRIVLILLALLGLGLLVVVGLARGSFRREKVPVAGGLQGEALENPTLMLEKWLAASGHPTTRQGGEIRGAGLPEGGTCFLLHLSQPLTAAEAGDLLAWVQRGGHLITDGSAAPFNDERGLEQLHKAVGVTLKDLAKGPLDPDPGHGEVTDRFWRGDAIPYRLRRSYRWVLVPERDEDWWYRNTNGNGAVVLSRHEGLGELTLLPDLSWVYREALTELDHAAYLEQVLGLGADREGARAEAVVWSRPVELSLFQWLKDHALPVMVALLLLTLAWVVRNLPRFGPLVPEPQPRRRSLLEHLEASARLMWQDGGPEHLARRTREALVARAQRLHPAFTALDLGGRAQWLADQTGADVDTVASALDDRPGRTTEDLAQALLTLEQLRQRLTATRTRT
jgi:hypothetical protein